MQKPSCIDITSTLVAKTLNKRKGGDLVGVPKKSKSITNQKRGGDETDGCP